MAYHKEVTEIPHQNPWDRFIGLPINPDTELMRSCGLVLDWKNGCCGSISMRINISVDADSVSWVLRSFLANACSSYEPGAPRRLEAIEETKQILSSIQDDKLRSSVYKDCRRYFDCKELIK